MSEWVIEWCCFLIDPKVIYYSFLSIMSGYYRHAATTLKSAFSARSVAIRQKMPRLMKPGQVEHHEHLVCMNLFFCMIRDRRGRTINNSAVSISMWLKDCFVVFIGGGKCKSTDFFYVWSKSTMFSVDFRCSTLPFPWALPLSPLSVLPLLDLQLLCFAQRCRIKCRRTIKA